MSSSMFIGFPSLTNKYVYTGGAWRNDYPITNAMNITYAKVARSSDLQPQNTKIILTSLDARPVRLVGIFAHNMDLDAVFSIKCYEFSSNTDVLLYDSGFLDVWESVYETSNRLFETENWFTGQYSDEERAGQIPSRIVILPEGITPNKIIFEFFNQTNAAGFIDIGLLEVAGAIELSSVDSPEWGAKWGYESQSIITRYAGGLLQCEKYAPSYVFQGEIPYMDNSKARQAISELFRQHGEHKPFIWVPFGDDELTSLRESKMVVNKQADLLTFATDRHMAVALNLIEWMG